MNLTPEIAFTGGRLRVITSTDVEALLALYQQQVMPGQKALVEQEQAQRMIDLAAQMASQQRGMMWGLELDGNESVQGVLSFYDWRPSVLKTQIRLDVLDQVPAEIQQQAIRACIDFSATKYHLRNFVYHWVTGQSENNKQVMQKIGFKPTAKLRDFWRTGQESYVDVEQFNLILNQTATEQSS